MRTRGAERGTVAIPDRLSGLLIQGGDILLISAVPHQDEEVLVKSRRTAWPLVMLQGKLPFPDGLRQNPNPGRRCRTCRSRSRAVPDSTMGVGVA